MSEKIRHLPVNWVDGMKISKTDFQNTENFLLDQIRDSTSLALNDFNFGLLASHEIGKDSLSLDINEERVEVYNCRAVARNGARIEVVDMEVPSLRQPMRQLVGGYDLNRVPDWYIVVKTNPFQRFPYGQPALDLNPVRHLHALQLYDLELVPADQIQSPRFAYYCIPVAKIRAGHAGIEQVRNYIPPFSSIQNSLELIKIHKSLEDDLFKIEQTAINVIKKLIRKREAEPTNVLAQDLYLIAWNVMDFITSNVDHYRVVLPQYSPVHMATFFMRLARTVYVSMRLTKEKDGLMNYFQNQIGDFSPATFESAFEGAVSLRYNHFEIRAATDIIIRFVVSLRDLFQKLEDLDYEKLVKYDPFLRATYENRPPARQQAPPPREQPPYYPPERSTGIGISRRGDSNKQGGGGTQEDDWGLR